MNPRRPVVSSPELDQLEAAAHETAVAALMAALGAAPAVIGWWIVRGKRRAVRRQLEALTPPQDRDPIDVESRPVLPNSERAPGENDRQFCTSWHPEFSDVGCQREPHPSGWHTFDTVDQTLIWLDDGTTSSRSRD